MTDDIVNNPKHYKAHPSGIECIDVSKYHCFCIGNVIKYIWRAGIKEGGDEINDLKKARWYLDQKIRDIENGQVS